MKPPERLQQARLRVRQRYVDWRLGRMRRELKAIQAQCHTDGPMSYRLDYVLDKLNDAIGEDVCDWRPTYGPHERPMTEAEREAMWRGVHQSIGERLPGLVFRRNGLFDMLKSKGVVQGE